MTKKAAFLALVPTVALLIALLATVPVRAQEGGFSEFFDNPELPGWERSPDAAVTGGVLRIYPGNFALKFGDLTDLDLSVRVRYTNSGEILVRYYFRDESHYTVHLVDGAITLERTRDGTRAELGQASLASIQPGTWMDLRVVVTGEQHEISLNEESLVSATDPEPLPPGAILFQVMGEAIGEFDDLVVVAEGVLPQADVGGEPSPTPGATLETGAPATSSGGVGDLLEELFASRADPLALETFLINLALAAVLSFILSRVYIHWGASLSNRRKFASNFMLVTITTTFIILVVRSSVALSLGLVGALSIVRFRTAVKEPEELAYLFFAIGLGIGLGDNQRLITILALVAATLVLGLMKLFRKAQADVNLHLTVASHNPKKIDLEEIVQVLDPHCAKLKLVRFDENDETLEASFLVEFARLSNLSRAKAAIRGLSDSMDITFLDNRGIW